MVARPLHARSLAQGPWADATWLILAPHADDEILGCGALINDAASRGRLAAIVFLTDSAGSHHCETSEDRRRLASLRRREARAAIRIVWPLAPMPLYLDWPDAHPHSVGAKAFNSTASRLAKLMNRFRVDAIAVTGRDEPHCDHIAAFHVAQEAVDRAIRPTRLFEYVVWAPQPPNQNFIAIRTAPVGLGRRKAALAQHRSQMTPHLGDGFRLPYIMREMAAIDILYTHRDMS